MSERSDIEKIKGEVLRLSGNIDSLDKQVDILLEAVLGRRLRCRRRSFTFRKGDVLSGKYRVSSFSNEYVVLEELDE